MTMKAQVILQSEGLIFLLFPRKQVSTFHANCLPRDNLHEMVILFLPLIQEGHLSVSGKRMHTVLVNRLED